MIGALIIFFVTLAFGLLLYYNDRRSRKDISGFHHHTSPVDDTAPHFKEGKASSFKDKEHPGNSIEENHDGEVCCGLHAICEKLLPPVSGKVVYFEDEELDRFRGMNAEDYSLEETDEFREVLTTLRPGEIADWLKSLTVRGINLPSDLRDEAILLLEEF